jgi:hypothetical protein
MSSPSNSPDDLCCLLAFFCSVEHEPACWLAIVSHSSSPHDYVSRLLGLHYEKLYLPLMLQKSNRHKVVTMNPSIESTVTNSYNTWSNFMTERNLNIEISYIMWNKRKTILFAVEVLKREPVVLLFGIRFELQRNLNTTH